MSKRKSNLSTKSQQIIASTVHNENHKPLKLFGMPATIHAKKWLSIKSRGDLKTAWIGLAHSLIHFFCKALV